jgi:hypothetical protein
MTLLGEIQVAALDSSVPLPDLLRKCKVLAARLKHAELANWVNHELNGYPDRESLPPYRILKSNDSVGSYVGSFGRQLKNVPVPVLHLPDVIRKMVTEIFLRDPIAQIATLAQEDKKGLQAAWLPDIVSHVAQNYPTYEDMVLIAAWRPLAPGVMSSIVDTVRTRILDFALAIEAENPSAGEAMPDKPSPVPSATVNHVYNTTILGGQAIVGNSGDASIGSMSHVQAQMSTGFKEPSQLLPLLAQLKSELDASDAESEAKAEALDIVGKLEKQAAGPKGKFDPEKALKYLQLLSTVVTVTSNTVPQIEHGIKVLAQALGIG